MKRALAISLVVILSLFLIVYYNTNSRIAISRLARKGEVNPGQLTYRIYLFGVMPVGNAVFEKDKIEEYEGRRVYHLSAIAQSLDAWSKFFRARAVLDSYVDMQELAPIFFRQSVTSPGKEKGLKEVRYNQKEMTMSIGSVTRQILPNTKDPLSLMLNIRRMDFDKIKDFEVYINTNQKNYILKGTVKDEKTITIGRKAYRTVLLQGNIKRKDKNPYHQSKITMVLLRQDENTPLLIKVFASGFFITAKLVTAR